MLYKSMTNTSFIFFLNESQGEEIFLDMFEDEYRSMTVSMSSFARLLFYW